MTKQQAILTQFSTAIPTFIGTYAGLVGMEQVESIFGYDLMVPFTAGGFIYLATGTILPSILEEPHSWKIRIVQIMSFVSGVIFMYYVGVLEHIGGAHDHSHEFGFGHNHSAPSSAHDHLEHDNHDLHIDGPQMHHDQHSHEYHNEL